MLKINGEVHLHPSIPLELRIRHDVLRQVCIYWNKNIQDNTKFVTIWNYYVGNFAIYKIKSDDSVDWKTVFQPSQEEYSKASAALDKLRLEQKNQGKSTQGVSAQ